jgi:hypothetical protein
MKPIKVVTPFSFDPNSPTQNLLGLGAGRGACGGRDFGPRFVCANWRRSRQLEDPQARIS